MSKSPPNIYWRVVYTDGGEFHTSAQSASEFILDRVFVTFMVLCVFMFSSLMLALNIPLIPQIILFGAGVVSTFFWLSVFITVYLGINKLLGIRTIYTPLLLFPMQVMNALVMDYVLKMFGTSYSEGFNGMWDLTIRTLIIFVCLDIFHGRFVAVQHGNYLAPEDLGPYERGEPLPSRTRDLAPAGPGSSVAALANPSEAQLSRPAYTQPPMSRDLDPTLDQDQEQQPSPQGPARSAMQSLLTISNKSFDLTDILHIKSEGHYLVVQCANQSTMVRGKLRDVAAEIDLDWGLQINRSVWVAHDAIEEVSETENGRLQAIMSDGSIFRVAESRRVFFLHSREQPSRG